MKSTLIAMASLAATAFASPRPQGVTESIAPPTPAPADCSGDYSGKFQISVVPLSSGKQKRQLAAILTLTLSGGILKDQADRTGYIASNYQFQFDAPPQAGSIYTAGFSACSNGTLALGGTAIWYQCLSGSFYNLYDRHWAAQCEPIFLKIKSLPGGASNYGNGATATTAAQPAESTPAGGEGESASGAASLSAASVSYDATAAATATGEAETAASSATAAEETASPNSTIATSTPTTDSTGASSSGSSTSTGGTTLATGNAATKQISTGKAVAVAFGAVGLAALL